MAAGHRRQDPSRHIAFLELLLVRRAAPSQAENDGIAPLWAAAEGGHTARLEILLGAWVDPPQPDIGGEAPAAVAARSGLAACLQPLSAPRQTRGSRTAVALRSRRSTDTACLELLLGGRAARSQAENDGSAPRWAAAEGGHTSCLKILLGARADLSQADTGGRAPL